MKRVLFTALMALVFAGASAQTAYDAQNIAQKDLNGTARFVGMGGAMSALGGDISTISTNPAGIGIFRSNDATLSLSYSITGTESNYIGNAMETNKHRWNFDNVGLVISNKIGNRTALRYVNFGFNYHKSKSFYRNMTMQGMMGTFDGLFVSQARYMAQQATNNQAWLNQYGEQFNFGSSDIYTDSDAGWLGAMGYQGWLIDEIDNGEGQAYSYEPYLPDEADSYFLSREKGGIDQFDFNVSFNFNERFYLGFTLGAHAVDYKKYSFYDEDYGNGEGYSLESFNRIHGSGVGLKMGAIVRPFEYSPLRIGLAIHTPIFYELTYTTGALLQSDMVIEGDTPEKVVVDTYEELDGRDMERDFNLQTPWLFNVSLGYTVGNYLALGAEYEYEDYSTMKFKYPDNVEMAFETDEVGYTLKGVNTFRVGAELKPIPEFSIRAGYNYSSAAFKNDAIKLLPDNSIGTDTDFSNHKGIDTYTLGVGYRVSALYADVAFKYNTYESDFYPFVNEIDGNFVTPEATKVNNNRTQVLFTLGYRF